MTVTARFSVARFAATIRADFTMMLIASELASTGIYSGVRGIYAGDVATVAKFGAEVVVFARRHSRRRRRPHGANRAWGPAVIP